jgi:hypothetical protein
MWHNIDGWKGKTIGYQKKMVFGIPPVENIKIFLCPNFSLIKKLKFSEFSQFLQLDCASSVCPAIFF